MGSKNEIGIEAMCKNLIALRLAHRWSVEQLSQISKIPEKTLRTIENGGTTYLDDLWTLCRLYRVPLRTIFTDQRLPEENS